MSQHEARTNSVFVDAGHYDISLPEVAIREGERIEGPRGDLVALTTPASLRTFRRGVQEMLALRERGIQCTLGVLIGDIAVPGPARPNSNHSLAPSFCSVLETYDLTVADIELISEATARNRGKKLIDRTRHRYAGAEHTYRTLGWAFCTDGEVLGIVSDRTLEGTDGMGIAVLSRGQHVLCPAILIGHKHLMARAGYREHWAYYSQVDDPFIGRKLWAAALAVEALSAGNQQLDVHSHLTEAGENGGTHMWRAERRQLTNAGEIELTDLQADLLQMHPSFVLL